MSAAAKSRSAVDSADSGKHRTQAVPRLVGGVAEAEQAVRELVEVSTPCSI